MEGKERKNRSKVLITCSFKEEMFCISEGRLLNRREL